MGVELRKGEEGGEGWDEAYWDNNPSAAGEGV